jgi:hypothetical protein
MLYALSKQIHAELDLYEYERILVDSAKLHSGGRRLFEAVKVDGEVPRKFI